MAMSFLDKLVWTEIGFYRHGAMTSGAVLLEYGWKCSIMFPLRDEDFNSFKWACPNYRGVSRVSFFVARGKPMANSISDIQTMSYLHWEMYAMGSWHDCRANCLVLSSTLTSVHVQQFRVITWTWFQIIILLLQNRDGMMIPGDLDVFSYLDPRSLRATHGIPSVRGPMARVRATGRDLRLWWRDQPPNGAVLRWWKLSAGGQRSWLSWDVSYKGDTMGYLLYTVLICSNVDKGLNIDIWSYRERERDVLFIFVYIYIYTYKFISVFLHTQRNTCTYRHRHRHA